MTTAVDGYSVVAVRHNFETAHRNPALGGKCGSLHGHSWWAEISIAGPATSADTDTLVEFGSLRDQLRSWIDMHLDHGTMLSSLDPLVTLLAEHSCKVFRFGAPDPNPAEGFASDLHNPTVEAVAQLLARVAADILKQLECADGAYVSKVSIRETHFTGAEWIS
ncbi:6-pyruvoyl trahydropterin synthase family protein [Streptomyces sp. NPDC085932]|uniref:6-pyruvoyl trahydropterin synthase family protein n=1 Tax=Streptomyces sp. NPDC085932 TaxID=3365741 RepID=UPI0037D6F4A3